MEQSLPRPPERLGRRLAAMVYDGLLVAALMFTFTFILIVLRAGTAVSPASWGFSASLVALNILFFGWFWTHGGQTLGMRAWKIRVERLDGSALRWRDPLVRYASAWVLLFPPGVGFFWTWLDRERRCWHDRFSATRVVLIAE